MRLALIQDQLLTPAGSERMFLYMCQEFREADLFTLAYNPDTTLPEFRQFDIKTSWMNHWVRDHDRFKTVFPLSTYVMQHWDFRGYDVILTSSATSAKYIRNHDATHICYCYYPTRAIWTHDAYFGGGKPSLKQKLFHSMIPWFKRRDLRAAAGVDHFIGISQSSCDGIRQYYGRASEMVYSPIDFDHFRTGLTIQKRDYFLIVSRLERWKCLDYAVLAFTSLGLPLRIVGKGVDEARLRNMAGPNVEFVGSLSDAELLTAYGEARAVVFTPELEYGLVPLEAAAAGTPVIALGKRGVLETMIDVDDPRATNGGYTAVFFYEQTKQALEAAVQRFQHVSFSRARLSEHASTFAIPEFKAKMRALVTKYGSG